MRLCPPSLGPRPVVLGPLERGKDVVDGAKGEHVQIERDRVRSVALLFKRRDGDAADNHRQHAPLLERGRLGVEEGVDDGGKDRLRGLDNLSKGRRAGGKGDDSRSVGKGVAEGEREEADDVRLGDGRQRLRRRRLQPQQRRRVAPDQPQAHCPRGAHDNLHDRDGDREAAVLAARLHRGLLVVEIVVVVADEPEDVQQH
mmetsp:Transcript_47631/g.154714  ORF Transcript_47631/g.154714 Transcript_47631/m.154714 type:complete len:200 (+) Transcript_47631:963-1562(+)